MSDYTFHEAANLFPMMNEEEFNNLKIDISANGLREPIWLYEGKIIDGRNRYNACQETAMPASFREWDGVGSLLQFVVSLNLNRRHLSQSQKAAMALKILPMLEAEAKRQQRIRASGERNEAGRFIPNLGESGQLIPNLKKPVKRSVDIAATTLGVSHGAISDMKRIAKVAPERAEDIKNGLATINSVMRELKTSGLLKPMGRPIRHSGQPSPYTKEEAERGPEMMQVLFAGNERVSGKPCLIIELERGDGKQGIRDLHALLEQILADETIPPDIGVSILVGQNSGYKIA